MKRGLIEACILKLLMRGDSYGYQLVRDAQEVLTLSESTLYPVLRRLENQQALTVYSMEHNGRLRRRNYERDLLLQRNDRRPHGGWDE